MRKTNQTELTNEVREALQELREIPWRELPLASAGYSEKNFPGIRRVLLNSMLDIDFIAKFMFLCGKKELVTEHNQFANTDITRKKAFPLLPPGWPDKRKRKDC